MTTPYQIPVQMTTIMTLLVVYKALNKVVLPLCIRIQAALCQGRLSTVLGACGGPRVVVRGSDSRANECTPGSIMVRNYPQRSLVTQRLATAAVGL